MSTHWVRPPAVAGMFYPADAAELAGDVDGYIAAAIVPTYDVVPRAVIAPHAGFIYSGPTAGHAYAAIAGLRGPVARVVLAGPAHRVAVRGVGLSSAVAFDGPLGPLPVDRDTCDRLEAMRQVTIADEAHAAEHSLEVQLPFIQRALGDVQIVPLAMGAATDEEVADVYDACVDDGTLLVVSSDLSHYHDDATAKTLDRRTAAAVVEGRADGVGDRDACGAVPIRGLLRWADRHALQGTLLDLRTSGDTAGDRDRVVGYGAFAFA